MSQPFDISNRFTDAWADLDPIKATIAGVTGRDHLCTDYSPDGIAERFDLYRDTRSQLAPFVDDSDPIQARAAKVTVGWIDSKLASHERGGWKRDLNHIYSPFQNMRDVFDVMPMATSEDWEAICSRLDGFGGMLTGYQESLTHGLSKGDTVARRQVHSLLGQIDALASTRSRFLRFPGDAEAVGFDPRKVSVAVDNARAAIAGFGAWIRQRYLPEARAQDGVGEERYLEETDWFLGMNLDPHETYEWGWSEVHRLRSEMEVTAAEIDPDLNVDGVIQLLESDPNRSAGTREEFVEFVSELQQVAISKLDGEHFDVPEPLRTVSVHIAPPGGSLGAWYVGPSEDFSRSGSIWYAPGERERLPYWQEVSTAYHEGFPGHHLQVASAVYLRDELSRFHRNVIWYSGAGEGWALYAERLMDELGYFERPEYRLGLLSSQLFRSIRVVVDIGCHLGKTIPDDAPMYGGEVWDYERAVDYMNIVGHQARDMAESEVTRYLGWWGQAISYKVGEREILRIRDDVMKREGPRFDRKVFHRKMLEAGAIRLDHLREELV